MLLPFFSVSVLFPTTAQETSRQIAEKPSTSAHQGIILNLQEGEIDLTKGHWTSTLMEGANCIKFRGDGSDSWNISKCFELDAFKQESENIGLLSREAGTLILTGELDFQNGLGRYSFTPNESFQKYLVKNKISDADDSYMLPLFLGNLETSFIDFLKEHYGSIKAEDLTELALHEVSLENFKEYLSLYRKYGNADPTLEEVIVTKTNGIDLQYVSELQKAGYTDLNLKEMMEAKAHGINKATIEGFAEAGFEDIPMEKLLETKVKGLTTATAVQLQQISDKNLSLDAVLQLQMQGVNETFIKDLKEVGLSGLNLQQVLKARVHEVEPVLVKSLRDVGLEDFEFEELLTAKVQGIDTAFVNSFKEAELHANDLQELISAKQHEIDFSSVDDWRDLGFEDLELMDLLKIEIHGAKVEQVKAFQKEGIEVFSIKELLSARIHGVDMEYIKQVRGQSGEANQKEDRNLLEEDPGESLNLHEYISLKLAEDSKKARELQELKEKEEQDGAEAVETEMFEISLPETEEQ